MREIDRLALIQAARNQGVDFITGQPIRDASDVVTDLDNARRDVLGDIVATSGRSIPPEHGGIRARRVGEMVPPKTTRGSKAVPPKAA